MASEGDRLYLSRFASSGRETLSLQRGRRIGTRAARPDDPVTDQRPLGEAFLSLGPLLAILIRRTVEVVFVGAAGEHSSSHNIRDSPVPGGTPSGSRRCPTRRTKVFSALLPFCDMRTQG